MYVELSIHLSKTNVFETANAVMLSHPRKSANISQTTSPESAGAFCQKNISFNGHFA